MAICTPTTSCTTGRGGFFWGISARRLFLAGRPARARRLEQVEVRAYGCLLEELAGRAAPGVLRDGPPLSRPVAWVVPALRPGFDEIVSHLDGLAAG
jgi:hypothetical protein